MLFGLLGVLAVIGVDLGVVVIGVVVIVVGRLVDLALICVGLMDTTMDSGVVGTRTRWCFFRFVSSSPL